MEKKLQEERLRCTIFKNDLAKAMRVLEKEIGKTPDLDELLNPQNGTWQGRAEKMEIMRGKIRDLQAQLGAQNQMRESSGMTNS